jgi:hypothetical protein
MQRFRAQSHTHPVILLAVDGDDGMATPLRAITSETADFEAARARWERESAARRALRSRLDGAKAALGLAENPPGEGDVRSPRIESLAAAYLGGRRANPALIRREIVEIEDALDQGAAVHAVEAASWRLAVEAEARRRAELLRPGHRQAVRRIAEIVEQLSAAVDAERAVRAALAEVGNAGALPDASREFGSLHEYSGLLSTWNRRMLAEGALDDEVVR